MKVRVYHAGYGCETGCCGHVVELGGHTRFEFEHPWDEKTAEDRMEWARQLAEKTIRKHWPDCLPQIDWSTLEFVFFDC